MLITLKYVTVNVYSKLFILGEILCLGNVVNVLPTNLSSPNLYLYEKCAIWSLNVFQMYLTSYRKNLECFVGSECCKQFKELTVQTSHNSNAPAEVFCNIGACENNYTLVR